MGCSEQSTHRIDLSQSSPFLTKVVLAPLLALLPRGVVLAEMTTNTVTPPLHTTQAVFPAEPDVLPLGHQSAAEHGHARPPTRKGRRRQHSKDTETGSSASESSDSEDDSWTRWEGVR